MANKSTATTTLATGTRDALGKGSFYHYDPEQLVLIKDPKHPLFDPRALESPDENLVMSMLRYGFKTGSSIELESCKGQLLVVDGRRRTIAAMECKRRQIEAGEDITIRVRCIIVKGDAFVGMILGNAHRKEENILQKGAKAQRALDNGYSEKEVSELFSVTTQTIRNWIACNDLSDLMKGAILAGRITVTNALELAKRPADQQAAVIAEAQETPIRGANGKEKVRNPTPGPVSKKVSSAQLKKIHKGLVNDRRQSTVSIQVAIALFDFINGDDPKGDNLKDWPALHEVVTSL